MAPAEPLEPLPLRPWKIVSSENILKQPDFCLKKFGRQQMRVNLKQRLTVPVATMRTSI